LTDRPRIVVTREIPEPAVELLRSVGDVWVFDEDRAMTVDELHRAVAGAQAVLAMLSDRVDDGFLEAAGPQLQVVADFAVGYDNIDVEACARRGVVAANTPGVLTEATADLAFALVLMATRRLGEAERFVRAGRDWSWSTSFMLGTGLQGKTLGIVGLGQIGSAVARRARAFSMELVYSGPHRKEATEAELEARYVSFDELLATADVVSLHCPLTDETRHLIDAEALRRMRSTAFLVNTTRGPVADEAALVAALRNGEIAGAGLDVYENEPELHPGLLRLENVVLLPHLGSATVETRTAMGMLAAENIVAVLGGKPAKTPVNG
jgi:glyoxylate reductase